MQPKEQKPPEQSDDFLSLNKQLLIIYGVVGAAVMMITILLGYFATDRLVSTQAPEHAIALADSMVYSLEIIFDESDSLRMQRLMEKIASLEDVDFVSIIDLNGIVLAHSDIREVGTRYTSSMIAQIRQTPETSIDISQEKLTLIRPLHGHEYNREFHDLSSKTLKQKRF